MLRCANLIIALLFLGVICSSYAKVIVNIRIYNYNNPDNVRHDGQKCENLHWFGDHCDPMFKICVTSMKRCDLVHKNINFWRNTKSLHNVFTQNIPVDKFPNSISIFVQVDDHDNLDMPDHIAVFSSNFQINRLDFYYKKIMTVQPSGLNVRIQASIIVKCAQNYGGPTCDKRLDQYNCDSNCRHGQCVLNNKDGYICQCQSGWSGEYCNQFKTNNCSLLTCTKVCKTRGKYKECTCVKNGTDIIICSEEQIKMSTKATEFSKSTQSSITHSKSTQSSRVYTKSTPSFTKISSTGRILEVTSLKSQTANDTESPQNSNSEILSNSKSLNNQKAHTEDSSMTRYLTPSTIIIVCLFLLLCICMISLFVIVQNWKRKTNSKLMHVATLQRPLPPIFYEKNGSIEKSKSLNNGNPTILRKSNSERESCTIPFGYNGRDSNLLLLNKYEMDNVDIYEEPIIDNMESLTCETMADDSDNSDVYEKPITKRF